MDHLRIVHLCNVLEVGPSKWLISKALISLFFYFWSWLHNSGGLGGDAGQPQGGGSGDGVGPSREGRRLVVADYSTTISHDEAI